VGPQGGRSVNAGDIAGTVSGPEPGLDSDDPLDSGGAVQLLVVDDEQDMESLFRLRFRRDIRAGRLTFRFFNDPVAALEAVNQDESLEVVITDLNMPGLHGLDLIGAIETMDRPVKVIVLTAYGDILNIRAAMMRGAFDFLMKPLDVDDLRTTLSKAVTITRRLRDGIDAAERVEELGERNRLVEEVFGRHVSRDVMAHLLASDTGAGLSERRHLTLLMADIRGFSHMVEALEPEEAVASLNDYLQTATEIILSHNGTIIEILGDGLLVFFGAPVEDEKAPEHAACAALELQLAMDSLNDRHREQGWPEMAVGIGIHTGTAVVGTIGSALRQKYAALGSSVNLVARIEDQTLGGQVLVSADTLEALGAMARTWGEPGELVLKGISDPVLVHDLVGLGEPYELALPERFGGLEVLEPPGAGEIGQVVRNRIGRLLPAAVVAIGPNAVEVQSELDADRLDEVVLRYEGRELYGKVNEAGDGRLLVAVTSIAGGAESDG
jgi:adenylate cyclase